MNAPAATPLFSTVELAPRDPILGVTETFNADPNPNKVNLGVGVYYDENGKLPLLACVQAAEKQMTDAPKPDATENQKPEQEAKAKPAAPVPKPAAGKTDGQNALAQEPGLPVAKTFAPALSMFSSFSVST